MKLYRGEFETYHPKFAAESKAFCGEKSGPVPLDASDIEYTAEEDQIIDDYNRNFGEWIFTEGSIRYGSSEFGQN